MPATADDLLQALAQGPLSAAELGQRLGISQPTVSRRLAEKPTRVLAFGPLRGRRYALRRQIRGQLEFPLSRVNAQGQLEDIGSLAPVAPSGFVFRPMDGAAQWHEGLPWWLFDMRPQGFLGRAFAGRHGTELELPPDPRDWSDDQVMVALSRASEDGVGNLLVGEAMRQAWLARSALAEPPLELRDWYAALALQSERGEDAGSSAGGEQPKFTASFLDGEMASHVLVKFTSAQDNPVVQRWKNLLACEHLALQALRAAGMSAARSRVIDHGGRRFLEVERFDRVGHDGRRGVVSLAALDAQFVGRADAAWPEVVTALHAAGRIDSVAADAAARLYAFGILIGNGDMHFGNLSFLHEGPAPYALAPAYDMLPMSLRPQASGALPDSAALHLPSIVGKEVWQDALPLAEKYWHTVQASPLIDAGFRVLAQRMAERVMRAGRLLGRLA